MPNSVVVTDLTVRSVRLSIAQAIRPTPGMASVMSEKTWSGSNPDTKVPEHRICATKPVATRGTSRARTAVSARTLHVVATPTRMNAFVRVTVLSGNVRHDGVPGESRIGAAAARRIRNSSVIPGHPRRAGTLGFETPVSLGGHVVRTSGTDKRRGIPIG